QKKLWVVVSLALNLGILFFFKYYNFAFSSLQRVFGLAGISFQVPSFDVLLPVGISFYTFQALSYTVDVYRGEIKPEHNVLKYALFVSFFPQLVAGPIERSRNLLPQIDEVHVYDHARVRNGLLRMLYGLFQKLVVADRLALLVNEVFNHYQSYAGLEIAVAAVLFTVQIYCDFGGYSNLAIGSAQVLGFRLMENFKQPYFARDIADFWKRWHISLSSLMRDYIYIPLGGSRRGAVRTCINLLLTFLASGLWHGAMWTFVMWGLLHGVYRVVGRATRTLRSRLYRWLHIRTDTFSFALGQRVTTFFLVVVSYIFFRANSMRAALHMLYSMFTEWNPWIFTDGTIVSMGLTAANLTVAVLAIAVVWYVDLCRERGRHLCVALQQQNMVFRWGLYYAAILAIAVFGIYGPAYSAAQFIYFQF
ncbi:MAG: MBOAT family O-acyltransferase, partial [Ruthenibacterium sp.]